MIFYKFHGNGNDFIVLDGMTESIDIQSGTIVKICDRKFGIGADGLIILKPDPDLDFEMIYYNSDGNLSSMCGNGGRCVAAFALWKGYAGESMDFRAYDGPHKAVILKNSKNSWQVDLSLNDVGNIEINEKYYFLNTGSPHYVEFTKNIAELDVYTEGSRTRYSEKFAPHGTNVNFVDIGKNRVFVRTYERGVEDETLSCGTGVTASAIAYYLETGNNNVEVHTTGGDFRVRFDHKKDGDNHMISNIWLTGPAELVFTGEIDI